MKEKINKKTLKKWAHEINDIDSAEHFAYDKLKELTPVYTPGRFKETHAGTLVFETDQGTELVGLWGNENLPIIRERVFFPHMRLTKRDYEELYYGVKILVTVVIILVTLKFGLGL